jgi:hypothetical protein
MEKLSQEVLKNGFVYKLVDRSEGAAIYAQYRPGGTLLVGYEVFIIRVQEEKDVVIKGTPIHYAHKELFPKDEDFGFTAWAFNVSQLKRAKVMFEGLAIY